MKIYITRHGQVCPQEFVETADYPIGDLPLTELGQKQAACLGEALKSLNFKGKILSSPYRRTMMTADIAASKITLPVYPESELRELFRTEETAQSFKGMTLDRIGLEFSSLAKDAALSYPWWTATPDTKPIIIERLKNFWDGILRSDLDEVLAVGHGASVYGSMYYFDRKYNLGMPEDLIELGDYIGERSLNCALSYLEIDKNGNLLAAKLFSTEHLEDALLTSNPKQKPRPQPVIK